MPVNSTHPDYDAVATEWLRARDVLGGEDAVKAGGQKYLARLDSQTDEEFAAYVQRASFFNATARTSEAYQGLIFRRPPFVKIPEVSGQRSVVSGLSRAMQEFANDADMLGTSLTAYAKLVVGDGFPASRHTGADRRQAASAAGQAHGEFAKVFRRVRHRGVAMQSRLAGSGHASRDPALAA